jgi:hypothetical protein
MKVQSPIRKRQKERGVALLIAIFVLLLISVVAISLIVSSGTESAMAGNYRTATGVYYAALAGLEEGRGRLLGKNAGSFKNTAPPGFIPSPLPMGQPVYIINPVGSETVAPWDPGSTYQDLEFNQEFQTSAGYSLPDPSPSTNSISTVAGVQGPLYKWVRINAVSEKSLRLYVDGDTTRDNQVLYYDNILSKLTKSSSGTQQVFEITSFAVLPNGSQKMLQYLVALVPANIVGFPSGLSFPAALTIAGSSTNHVAFSPPTSSTSYWISGVDLTSVPYCTAGPAVHAIGVAFDSGDVGKVINGGNGSSGIPTAVPPNPPTNMQPKYDGITTGPDVVDVSGLFPSTLQTPSQLDNLAKSIMAYADATLTPNSTTTPPYTAFGSDLTPLLLSGSNPTGMSPTNPMTVVVNGDLDLNGWHNTGYGLLLVTGNLSYDPDATWKGIVLVIGKGSVSGTKGGSGEFDGTFFVAKTRDSSWNLLPDPDLGKASITFGPNMGSVGIRYSSCWVKAAQPTGSFKILSFHELSQ